MFWSILTVAALCLLQLAQAQMKASTCDVDSSMELFLEPFARRVDELNMFAQGAKGFLIEYPGSAEVLRISCAHGANSTRRDTDCVFTCDLAYHLQAYALQFEPVDSNMHIVLAKSIELYKVHNRRVIDIMSLSGLGDEHAIGVLPGSVANNVFGVNSPMYREQVCINASWHNETVIENKKHGSTCTFHPPLRFVVEVSRRFAGSLADLGLAHAEGRIKLTASDLLYFGFGYFHDLREMLVHYGWFPTDAHPGNLLYNMTLCGRPSSYWNDLGRTSSDGRLDGQIRESIQQFIDFVRKCLDYTLSPDELSDHTQVAVSKDDVNRVLSHMRVPHANESYVACFSAVLDAMYDEIMGTRSFTQEFRTMLWLRVGSSSRLVVSDMGIRQAEMAAQIAALQNDIAHQNITFQAQNAALLSEIGKLNAKVEVLLVGSPILNSDIDHNSVNLKHDLKSEL